MTLSGTFSIVLVVTHIKESKIIWGQLSTKKHSLIEHLRQNFY